MQGKGPSQRKNNRKKKETVKSKAKGQGNVLHGKGNGKVKWKGNGKSKAEGQGKALRDKVKG